MPIKIGINGFGRIGRYLLRLLAEDDNLQVVAINARAENKVLSHIFKYDSVHGTFEGDVSYNDDGILIGDKLVNVTRKAAGEWEWKKFGVDFVIETTGSLRDKKSLNQHIECGAKKVILSAPGTDMDATIVMGVNQDIYDPAKHNIVSNASCTTNCLAPVAKVVNDSFGIKHGLMTTIHSYTMSQRILDGSHRDLRRARAAAVSMLPSTTGAAKATALVIPELEGKLDGMAVRVPTPNVSMVDLTCELERDTTVEDMNYALKQASESTFKGVMGYTEIPLVSVDYNGSSYGGVVDALCTQVIDKRMVKLIIWYDNEAGFTWQLLRLIRLMAKTMPS